MKTTPVRSLVALAALLLPLTGARADVKLPALISDNMVLQQDAGANVWGWAEPNEKVSIQLKQKKAAAVAGADGVWSARLDGLTPGEAGDMTIAGKNTIVVHNVAVGEVWVCSGQSNMEFKVANVQDAQKEIAGSENKLIRMFTVERKPSATPLDDCKGQWKLASPENTPTFSGVAYFFGRDLFGKLKVPIGLIHSSWGGTPAEYWTPTDVIAGDPDFQAIVQEWLRAQQDFPKAKDAYEAALAKWKVTSAEAKAAGKTPPQSPRLPKGGDVFGGPGCLYNGMIAPLLPYTVRGVTWYQGESNATRPRLYKKLFPTMIVSWRERWTQPEMPFLFVQLANFMGRATEPGDSAWAELREAQLETLALRHTGMAVAIDIGDAKTIHPLDKQDVGRRLALSALATVYYEEVEFSGPIATGSEEEEGKMRVTWRYAEGLKTTDGEKPKSFALAGADRKFYWADAEIQGDHVILRSDKVPKPVAVRYAWADNPEVNLVNASGLPASPFRSDEWPPAPKPKAPEPAK